MWSRGITIFIALIAIAFLGYTLPYGRISFWGATVITNFFRAVPFIGGNLVIFLWGNFSVRQTTISFFYSLHYLLPFILLALVIIHLVQLHEFGSKSKSFLTIKNKNILIEFNNYLIQKDLVNLLVLLVFVMLVLIFPYYLGDRENFILANSLSSPLHIKPEWYFLFLYAILRSVPHKLVGVILIFSALLVFYLFPFKKRYHYIKRQKVIFYLFLSTLFLLTWLGGIRVEQPYLSLSQFFTVFYFVLLYFL